MSGFKPARLDGDPVEWPQLYCPVCHEGGYLHHRAVNVYDRADEDAGTGTHVYSCGSVAAVNTSADMAGNPSPRRDGLTIEFYCEICDSEHVLAIFQHKGKTYGGWRT